MVRQMRYAVFGALCLLASSATAPAQSTSSILSDFGFIGTWAMRCGAAPAADNITEVVTVMPEGTVRFTTDLGPRFTPNNYVVLSARRIDPKTIVIRIRLNNDILEDLTVIKDGNGIRTMTNRKTTGEVLVRHGVILSNGRKTPWMRKCG